MKGSNDSSYGAVVLVCWGLALTACAEVAGLDDVVYAQGAVGEYCEDLSDCESNVCSDDRCQEPTCTDTTQNGAETGVDCGGGCKGCPYAYPCVQNGDCESGYCVDDTCVGECFNGVNDGGETDIDCGGTCSTQCGLGKACGSHTDCTTGWCVSPEYVCTTPP